MTPEEDKDQRVRRRVVPVWVRVAAGALIGAAAGYLVYRLVGCSTGTCPITGNWILSTFYGAGVGVLLGVSI